MARTRQFDVDITFLALARDCGRTLRDNLRALEKFESAGLHVRAIIGENGSRDDTRSVLEAAAAESHLIELVDTSFMSRIQSRLERLAKGREHLAVQFRQRGISTGAVCVVDVDEPFLSQIDCALLSAKLSRLLGDDSTFAIAATSRPTYYDLLAYEDDSISFVGLDRQIADLTRHPIAYYRFFRDYIYPHQERLTSSADVTCTSAFNGLCLYTATAYAQGSYLPTEDAASPWTCEHVTFNRSVAKATRQHLLVDAELVLRTPDEHGRKDLLGFTRQRLKKLPKFAGTHVSRSG
jgi:hypothetical protein